MKYFTTITNALEKHPHHFSTPCTNIEKDVHTLATIVEA